MALQHLQRLRDAILHLQGLKLICHKTHPFIGTAGLMALHMLFGVRIADLPSCDTRATKIDIHTIRSSI